jgi:hypothetical protein
MFSCLKMQSYPAVASIKTLIPILRFCIYYTSSITLLMFEKKKFSHETVVYLQNEVVSCCINTAYY